jgi:5'-nucleotidase
MQEKLQQIYQQVLEFLKKYQDAVVTGVVIVVGLLMIVLFLRGQRPNPQVSSTSTESPQPVGELASPSASVAPSPASTATAVKPSATTPKVGNKASVRKVAKKAVKKSPVKVAKTKGATYVVRRGDSLWKIAVNHYGRRAANWMRIYNANRKVVGPNPHLIYPKQRLTVPAKR